VAKAIKSTDAMQTTIFLYENFTTRFGCSKVVIIHQGFHVLNDAIDKMTNLIYINQ
jgi:hypothetical protein